MSQILPLVRRIAQRAGHNTNSGRAEKFFLFKLGRKVYTIPAVDVTEVMIPVPVIDIPQKTDFLTGVINVRGVVVPIIDLRSRIGITEPFQQTDSSKMLLFTLAPDLYAGMFIDEIECRLRDGIVEPLPENIKNEKTFRVVSIEMEEYPVMMVDVWIEQSEIDLLHKVVASF